MQIINARSCDTGRDSQLYRLSHRIPRLQQMVVSPNQKEDTAGASDRVTVGRTV
jgi:hypothetical protein